jgi:hypothetical protein
MHVHGKTTKNGLFQHINKQIHTVSDPGLPGWACSVVYGGLRD